MFLLSLWLWCQRIQGAAFVPSRGVVVRGSVDEIPRGGAIDDDSDDESEESEELDTSLASSAVKSAVKKKEEAATAAKKAVKKAVNTKLAKKKSGGGLRIPYILRACLNPLTVFAMTKAYWASLFNLEYGKEVRFEVSLDTVSSSSVTLSSPRLRYRTSHKSCGRLWSKRLARVDPVVIRDGER